MHLYRYGSSGFNSRRHGTYRRVVNHHFAATYVALLSVTAEVAETARDIVVDGSVLHTIVLAILCESILHSRLSLCVARIYSVKSPDALRHRSRMCSVAARMYSVEAPVQFATVLGYETIISLLFHQMWMI